MSHEDDALVSRSEIADLVGVKRPAVTNWERRHGDFPGAVPVGDQELFRVQELLAWLGGRTIPANARRPHEQPGTTYADRMRDGLRSQGRSGSDNARGEDRATGSDAVRHIGDGLPRLWFPADAYRGLVPLSEYLDLLLSLVHLRGDDPARWAASRAALGNAEDPGEAAERFLREVAETTRLWASDPGRLDRLVKAVRQAGLGELVQEVDRLLAPFAAEGRVRAAAAAAFEALVQDFTRRSGPRGGGYYFTPRTVARLMASVLDSEGLPRRTHDPFCRAGELLAAAIQGAEAHGAIGGSDVTGEYPGEHVRTVAALHLDLQKVRARFVAGPSRPSADMVRTPRFRADRVLCNPPFNLKATSDPSEDHGAWPFGAPPAHNANFAWLQYAVALLTEHGRACVLMPNGASFSQHTAEREIRARMVASGAVLCLVALPPQLFVQTGIPVTLWVLRRPTDRAEDVLFIDARHLGRMASRTQRVLTDEDIEAITGAYRAWTAARSEGRFHGGVEGLSRAVGLDEIHAADDLLNPPQYVAPAHSESSPGTVADLPSLLEQLTRLDVRASRADRAADRLLKEISTWPH